MSQKKKLISNAAAAPTVPSKHSNVETQPQSNTSQVQNFLLIWLDTSIDEVKNKDSINTISKLRKVINTIHIFISVNECIDFINKMNEEKVFMISSGALGQTIVPTVHDKPQIRTIYIFCGNKTLHEQWAKQWAKVKGVFTDIQPICEALKKDVQECDQDTIPISFVATIDGRTTNKNLDQLDPSFMYTQILKEILLTIDFEQEHFREFITYCREKFDGNTRELKNIDKFEREYRQHTPIWWYTYECFLFSMLNRALRSMDIDIIIKLGFFLCDLHRQIVQLHSEQYSGHHHSDLFIVYRGQSLSHTDFDQLVTAKGGLIPFNNFLTTHRNRRIALEFTQHSMGNPDQVNILFVMEIDPSISSVPFADIRSVSCCPEEEEILFSTHSVFRIGQIKQIDENKRLWQVDLSLTNDNDPQLYILTESLRKEIFSHKKGWDQLGELLIKMGQFDKAHQIYYVLFNQTSDDHEKANIYYKLGYIKKHQGEYTEAITFYEKSIEIKQKILFPTHSDLAVSYNDLGLLYGNMDNYSKALSYHEKALIIYQKCLPPNHPNLAISYNSIGQMYVNMKDYSKALSFYERALDIAERSLPANHPSVQTYKKNIESLKNKM